LTCCQVISAEHWTWESPVWSGEGRGHHPVPIPPKQLFTLTAASFVTATRKFKKKRQASNFMTGGRYMTSPILQCPTRLTIQQYQHFRREFVTKPAHLHNITGHTFECRIHRALVDKDLPWQTPPVDAACHCIQKSCLRRTRRSNNRQHLAVICSSCDIVEQNFVLRHLIDFYLYLQQPGKLLEKKRKTEAVPIPSWTIRCCIASVPDPVVSMFYLPCSSCIIPPLPYIRKGQRPFRTS
jgi:hypothetical protein